MHQIDNPTARTTLPAATAAGTAGYFSDGNPVTGEPATIVPAEFLNGLMMEIINVITGAGITLNKADRGQLLAAIRALIASGGASGIPWGAITGTLANQIDLKNALAVKSDTTHTHAFGVADIVGLNAAMSPGKSLVQNGYWQMPKLPGETKSLIMQWGVDGTFRYTGASPVIPFPIAFPNQAFIAIVVSMNTDANNARDTFMQVVGMTLNNFTYFVNLTPVQGSIDGIQGAHWFALGC